MDPWNMWQTWEVNTKRCSENLGEEDHIKKSLVEELITKFILNKFRENIYRTELARGPFERT
jgi:hypothetical protein